MTHIRRQHRRPDTVTERAGAPRRRSGAHSPRVTPVDMVAGSLKVLGAAHEIHQRCLL